MMTAAMMVVTMTMLEHVLSVDRPTRAVGGVLLKIILISLALSLIFTHLPSNAGAGLHYFDAVDKNTILLQSFDKVA